MPKSRPNWNPGPAELGLRSSGAGKGDKDRSPGWRKNYDEINWSRGLFGESPFGDGWVTRRAGVFTKKY